LTKENKNHFRLAQNLSGNFSPGFPDPKIFCPTFYRGSNKRCYYSPNQNREKKCTNLQNFVIVIFDLTKNFWFKIKAFLVFGWYFAESSKFFMENLI